MRRDPAILNDILLACQNIADFIAGYTHQSFLNDMKTQAAVLHEVLIIGEATKKLSDEIKGKHAKVPWEKIAGMRNRLIHEYRDVDLDEVWNTAKKDIPALQAQVDAILNSN